MTAAIFSLVLVAGLATAETLKVPLVSIPKEVVPAKTLDLSSAIIVNHLFEGLFAYDSSNKLIPHLVQSFTISPDGKTYVLRLKPGLKFSNNTDLTAAMVKRSLENAISILGESSRWAFGTMEGYDDFINRKSSAISGIKIKGRETVSLRLVSPYSPILQVFVSPYFKIALNVNGTYLGTGPFGIKEMSENGITMEVLPWRRDETRITNIVFSKVNSREEMIAPDNLKKHDVVEVLSAWEIATDSHHVVEFPYLQANLILFNTRHGVFKDRVARKSFLRALRKNIDYKWFGWQATAAGIPFANNLFKDPIVSSEKEVVTSSVTVYYTDSAAVFNKAGIDRLRERLQQEGMRVTFTKIPIGELLLKFKDLDYEAALIGYSPDIIDPDGLFFPLLGSGQQFNFTGYSSPMIDSLLRSGRAETDINKRFSIYRSLTMKVYEDCPIGFLGATHGRLLVSKKYVLPQINGLGIYGFQLNTLKPRE